MAFPNRFAGTCVDCRLDVPAEAGICFKDGGRWAVMHDGPLACEEAREKAAAEAKARPSIGDPVESPGIYRTPDERLWKVQLSEYGRLYCKEIVVIDGVNPSISLEYAPGAIARLSASMKLTQEEAAEFGARFRICIDCGTELSHFQSYAAGYGKTCAKNNGWWYPGAVEARRIIAEREGRTLEVAG